MIINITLEQEDFDHMHDVIYDVLGYEPTNQQIQDIWDKLPDEIQGIAIQWGTSDTLFGDELHEWLTENKSTIK